MSGRLLWAVVLTAATALSAGAQAKDKDRDRNRDRDRDRDAEYTSRIDTVVPLGRNGAVEVRLHTGEIIVTSWTRSEVRVRGTSERGQIRLEAMSSHIEIGTWPEHSRHGEAHVEITVPEGTRLTVSGNSADVSVRGVKGEVEVTTMNGDVEIDNASSRVSFESVSGDVQISRVQGDLRGEAMSGEIDVTDVAGEVDLESVSGDLTLHNVRSRSVRAETVSGNIEFDGRTESGGRYDFASHSGDVRLLLPAALGALISVETFSGTIDSDFPIELRPGQRHGKEFEFQVGDGGARIGATSFSGGIYIQRSGTSRNPE
ncbi:MAG TPA: DUF4097 family beta strand repeat-containing protein [Gemmatimonadaceae bacterium]|nr:DUF4097 family beta strand repeat-containing protein [Gemmatimonadaceae bacterium]